MSHQLLTIILAAGMGTRMKSDLPKVMHRVAGLPMVSHVVRAAEELSPDQVVAVIGPDMQNLADTVAPYPSVEQRERLGTGHAVLAGRSYLEGFSGDVLVLYGDNPLMTGETLSRLVAARRGAGDPAVAVLGFTPDDPTGYGRLILDDSGGLAAIVEEKEATEAERKVDFCNSGVMCFDGARLLELLDAIDNGNAKGEYYLTDAVKIARSKGWACVAIDTPVEETLGVNSRAQLAVAEAAMQVRLRSHAMAEGATLVAPETVFFSVDTKLGRDVIVEPNVVFGAGVTVADGVTIKAFSHLEGCHIASGADIGPYARLRPGAEVGSGARIGNFVEVKKARIDEGAKVNHLSYVGDAVVGAGANIGAGTITCNYDGYFKSLTEIGAGAFIGSNTALVAPVKVGDGAIVGAGSTITTEVPAEALAVERARTLTRKDWATSFRERRAAEKEQAKKTSN